LHKVGFLSHQELDAIRDKIGTEADGLQMAMNLQFEEVSQ
jgi:hypothetical protein